tara:strand:- start:235 stop:594 length:360 start_codon:yes stop_codon:yes gene_type:complete
MTTKYQKHIFICINERPKDSPRGDCKRCGGMEIRMKFVQLINQYGLKGKVRANKAGCLDVCELGAAVVIYPDNIWYTEIKVEDVEEIFITSVIGNKIVNRLHADKSSWKRLKEIRESKQ